MDALPPTDAATAAESPARAAVPQHGGVACAAPVQRAAPEPQQLHPLLWRAAQLGSGVAGATATGFAALDAQLPGSGWPHRVLTELLLPHLGIGEMRLLAPALAAITCGRVQRRGAGDAGRCVMLFDPPASPSAWVLERFGIDLQQLLIVHGREAAREAAGSSSEGPLAKASNALGRRPPRGAVHRLLPSADLLWALEQALKSGHVGAVLAWPAARLRADAVRRLQLAAAQHDGPVFLFRDITARLDSSPAPLRLALHPAGPGALSVRVLKRRGPAHEQPLTVELPPVLPAGVAERAHELALARPAPGRSARPPEAVSARSRG